MSSRAAFIVAAVAGLAAGSAQAQEVFKITYSWFEVEANTTTPASGPLAGNSVVDPGEGARIGITINILKNGLNAVGMTTTYTPPPGPGTGVIVGLGSVIYSLYGTNEAQGSWAARGFPSYVTVANGWAGTSVGSIAQGGATISLFGTGQFLAPGSTANSLNPLTDFYSGTWTPALYAARTVNFKAQGGPTGSGQSVAAALRYGIAQPDPADPSTWYDLYLSRSFGEDYGQGVNIPVAPAPGSLAALFASGCLVNQRRRR